MPYYAFSIFSGLAHFLAGSLLFKPDFTPLYTYHHHLLSLYSLAIANDQYPRSRKLLRGRRQAWCAKHLSTKILLRWSVVNIAWQPSLKPPPSSQIQRHIKPCFILLSSSLQLLCSSQLDFWRSGSLFLFLFYLLRPSFVQCEKLGYGRPTSQLRVSTFPCAKVSRSSFHLHISITFHCSAAIEFLFGWTNDVKLTILQSDRRMLPSSWSVGARRCGIPGPLLPKVDFISIFSRGPKRRVWPRFMKLGVLVHLRSGYQRPCAVDGFLGVKSSIWSRNPRVYFRQSDQRRNPLRRITTLTTLHPTATFANQLVQHQSFALPIPGALLLIIQCLLIGRYGHVCGFRVIVISNVSFGFSLIHRMSTSVLPVTSP